MNSKLKYIVVYLFLITFVVVGISFSRFTTSLTNTGAENTEPPSIEFTVWALDYSSSTVSLAGMVPGESRGINIEVKNWKDEGETRIISGYNQRVDLEVETTGNLPLTFALYEQSEQSVVHLNSYGTTLYKSDGIEFTANYETTKNYILTVKWPGEIKAEKYKDEIDYIVLRLKAAQVQ